MGKKYTTDEIGIGDHSLDSAMMSSLASIVGDGLHSDAGYLTTYTDTNTTYNFAGSTFTSRNSGNPIAIDSATSNMTGYTTNSTAAGFNDGGLFVAAYSTSWVSQIFSNFRTGELSTRGKNNGTWQAWRTIHDSGHFSTADVANGKTAHGWGNHADEGYLTSYNDTNTWRGIHDTPVDGATTVSISSNWAFDNVKTAVPAGALFTDTNTTYNLSGYLTTSGKAADSELLDGLNSTAYMRDDGWNTSPGQDADTQTGMRSDFSYGNNAPNVGELLRFGAGGYSTQFSSQYAGVGKGLNFRTRNGDAASWNPWYGIWHTGNLTSNSQLTNGAGYITDGNTNWNNTYGFVTSSGNTIIGTDTDVNTSGATIIDNLYMTDGVITSHGTRVLTLGDLGYTGATNANYITNNNQLTNGAGYITSSGNATTATTAVSLYGLGKIQSTSSGTSYQNNYQVRENNGAGGNTAMAGAPTLSFHWSGVVASSIMVEAGGRIGIYNNPGTGYESFIASTITASSSHRAPIFYDSNNTGYYLNPASTSSLNIVQAVQFQGSLAGTASNANTLDSFSSESFLRSDADDTVNAGVTYTWTRTDTAGIVFVNNTYDAQLAMGGWTTANSSNVSRIRTSSGNLHMDSASNGAMYLNWYSGGDVKTNSILQSDASLRAPIFYDSANTAFYCDPSSTSYLSKIWARGASTGNAAPRWDTSFHVAQSQHFYAHNSTQAMYIGESNTVNIRSIGLASGSLRAPVFYDSNDTAYYGNFASNSRYNTAQGNYLGLGAAANTSGVYRLNMGGSVDMNNNGIDYISQLHFNDNVRFYDDGNDSYLNFKYGDASTGGIKFLNGGGSVKGYVYANNDGFGLLDSDGTWAVRTRTGTSPLELSCDGNLEFYVYNSYTYSPGSSRAPVFYDSDNTSYYLNLSSTGTSATFAGSIGIGTTNPSEKLEVVGSLKVGNIKIQNSVTGRIGFNRNTSTGAIYSSNYSAYQINGPTTSTGSLDIQSYSSTGGYLGVVSINSGNVTANNFILSSDQTLKEDVKDLDVKVDAKWRSYKFKNTEETRYGVIAQELEETNPELVAEDDKGLKSVKYIDLLIAKIAELEARLEKLEK